MGVNRYPKNPNPDSILLRLRGFFFGKLSPDIKRIVNGYPNINGYKYACGSICSV